MLLLSAFADTVYSLKESRQLWLDAYLHKQQFPSGTGSSGAKAKGTLRGNATTILIFRGGWFKNIKTLAQTLPLYLLGRSMTQRGREHASP